jgi:hypothetical protein
LNVTAIEVYDKKRFLVSYVPTDFDSELVGTVDINALRLPGGPISCNGRSEINNRSTWAVTQDSIIPGDPSNPTATGNYKAHPEVVSLPLGQLVTVNSYQGDDWAKVTVDGKNMMIHRAYILPALNVCHAAGVTKPSSQNNQNNSSRCGQFTNVGC